MRILYYNWDHLDGNSGGGVTVYQRNLINGLNGGDNKLFYINS